MSPPIRVLLAADDPLVRGGLLALAAASPGVEVVAQVSLDESAAAISAHTPEVLLWEVGPDPRTALALLPPREPEGPPSIVLLADDRYTAQAISAGARGLLPRDVSSSKLAATIAAVAQGLFVADETVWAPGTLAALGHRANGPDELTAREHEVLQLLAEGLSNKEIAQRLGFSDHTAKFHVNAILTKLGAQSRTDAVVRAARIGLLVL